MALHRAAALLGLATAWSPPRPPRCNRIRLREGAFPEPDFARGRQSLRGLWRLQRTCEDEGDCQDIVVNLKADGYKHGQATLKLKFEAALDKKLYCLFLPIYEKSLEFDSYWNAKIV